MSARVVIRPATERDAPTLAALSGQLGYGADEGVMAERLRRAAGDASRIVAAAELEGRVVGCMEVAISEAFESGRWSEIRGLIVDEAWRGEGVGAALVAFARAWTKEHGLATLRVRTNEVRARAHAFYERNGFTKTKSQRVYDARLDVS